jgi:hypothetical protein
MFSTHRRGSRSHFQSYPRRFYRTAS